MQNNCLRFLSLFLLTVGFAQTPDRPSTSPAQNSSGNPQQAGTAAQQADNLEQIRSQMEEGIKHVLVSQIEAWNRGDLEAFMDGYWRSPELTFFSGANVYKGWQAALQRYHQAYQGAGKEMGKLDFQDLNIDLLGRQSAVVTGKWQLTMSGGKMPHGVFTLIFKKLPPGWRIVHDHSSSAEK
jgi:ketosteroid isomerase-like protein